jgi:hypothetical protein
MITRKITALLLALGYSLLFVKYIIYLPYEIKALGKSRSERYDITSPIYDNPRINFFESIIDVIWPIVLLTMLIFLLTFVFEKKSNYQILNEASEPTTGEDISNPNDQPSVGLNIISFLIPLVGLIIYLTERDRSPRKATSAGKAALWGVGVTVILSMISFFIVFALISSVG